mgnify:CR=1 FL=1
MSGRKKKLSLKLKKYNVLLIVALIVLMVLLAVLMIVKIFGNNDYYRVESRKDNIEKSKQQDRDDYETIGWVRVQGTNIDYPLFGVIKDSYEYPVTESYLWSLNMDSKFHDTMITYGHNVMNLGPNPIAHDDNFTRMEELMNFVYYDFAQENQYIQLSMNGEDYLYKIMAVNFMTVADFDEYPEGEWAAEDKDKYMERIFKESIYDYDVDYTKDDKVISVVTCSRFFTDGQNYDFIVTGRLVKAGEDISKSSVRRNKNYEKIDTILKGAEADEKSVDNA